MEDFTFMEMVCSGCCGLMAEMGNILGMSYQKVNVILFVFAEPLLTAIMVSALLCVLKRVPAHRTIWRFSSAAMFLTGGATLLLLMASGVKIFFDWNQILDNPASLLHLDETSVWIRQTFKETVDWLVRLCTSLEVSYSTINVILYIIAIPSVILSCYFIGRKKIARMHA